MDSYLVELVHLSWFYPVSNQHAFTNLVSCDQLTQLMSFIFRLLRIVNQPEFSLEPLFIILIDSNHMPRVTQQYVFPVIDCANIPLSMNAAWLTGWVSSTIIVVIIDLHPRKHELEWGLELWPVACSYDMTILIQNLHHFHEGCPVFCLWDTFKVLEESVNKVLMQSINLELCMCICKFLCINWMLELSKACLYFFR